MTIKLNPVVVVFMLLIPATGGCNSAPGEHQDGRVLQVGNLPCFSVADSDEARATPPKLAVLEVNEQMAAGVSMRWELSFVGEKLPATTLPPATCITYGTAVKNSETMTPAAPLEVGKRYEAGILSHILKSQKDEWRMRDYRAKFCLTENADKKITVHEVLWDEKMDKWRWDVCGLENSAE